LLAREGGDLPRFYAEVRRLAGLPQGEREAELRGLVVAR
jgi:predicted aminopeptidase